MLLKNKIKYFYKKLTIIFCRRNTKVVEIIPKYIKNYVYKRVSKIIELWFTGLFKWLDDCEKVFGFEKLKGYETKKLYAYLAERYLSYWFKKYSNCLEWSYVFIDTEKNI